MGMMLLNIALFVAGVLILPPALLVATKGMDAFDELAPGSLTETDKASPFLAHIAYIDMCKNFFQCALCLVAITFPPAAKKATALLSILLMIGCLGVQVMAPIKASIAPYPSMDGIFANPMVLPICGGQITLLALGVMLSSADPVKAKSN